MRRIVLDMQYNMFADAISQALSRSDPDFLIRRADSPDQTVEICKSCLAYTPPAGLKKGLSFARK